MVLQTLASRTQRLYFATTDSDSNGNPADGTRRVYSLNLATNQVTLLASPESVDLATAAAVGGGLRECGQPCRRRRG